MRLIDVDAYSKKVCTYNETGCGSCNAQTICPFDEPIVDAVPVRHGKWIDRNGAIVAPFWERYECSECGARSDNSNYCPNCGARMDKDE